MRLQFGSDSHSAFPSHMTRDVLEQKNWSVESVCSLNGRAMYSQFNTSLELFDFETEGVVDEIPQYCDIQPPLYGLKTMDSVYGDYGDESNGPFLSKRDPLLSSSAGNLFALSAEVGTARLREEVFTQQAAACVQYPSLAQLKQFHALTPLTATMGSINTGPAVKVEEPEKQQNICIRVAYQESMENAAKARPCDQARWARGSEVKEEGRREDNNVGKERERLVGSVPISCSPVGGDVEQVSPPARARRRLRSRSMRSVSHTSLSSGELSGHDSGTDDDFENENSPRKRGRKKETGDDFSPNPERLLVINNQLKRLNKMMNDMTPVNEMPTHAKNKGRRERNKLASRACRLKKKATYEANKLKLHGLEKERDILVTAISQLRQQIGRRASGEAKCMIEVWNEVAKPAMEFRVAGRMNDYVNEMLESQAAVNYRSWGSESDSN